MKSKPTPKPVRETGLPSRPEVEGLRQKTIDLVTQKPGKAAMILAEWIKQPASCSTSNKKKAG